MLPEPQQRGDCKPCRHSKAKCDRKKPRCTECINNHKTCGGYDMGHIFINVGSTEPPPLWNRTQNAQKHLVLDLASQSQNSNTMAPSLPSNTSPPPSFSYDPAEALSMTSLAPALPDYPASGRDPTNIPEIVNTFLDLYYRRFGPGKTSTEMLTPGNECGGWRLLLPYWIGQSSILDTAIGALAATFVGAQYQDENLIDQGRNTYLKALQMVQQALSQSGSTARKDLLATTLVMSSTELFLSNGGSPSQLAHIQGATRLLDNAFQTGDFEELHVYILNQGLFEAISTRRYYVFSAPSYRDLVRQMYSVPRTSRNDLYVQWTEVILPLPNILHAADNVNSATSSLSSTPASSSAILAVLDDLTALEHSITPWYERLKASNPGPWIVSAAQTSADFVPFPLQFMSIEICTLYCLHWSSQLVILEARQTLNMRLPPSAIPEHPSTGTFAPQMAEYASLVCRSIQFCTQGKSFAAMENILLPLYIVATHYMRQGDEDRMRWCVGAFGRIAKEQKIGYAIEKLDLDARNITHGSSSSGGIWDSA